MNIWLVQYLCPSRHAICAVPYDRDKTEPTQVEQDLLKEVAALCVELKCGLCGSHDLHFEHGKLAFTDWETALHHLRKQELANLTTRAWMNQLRADEN